MSLGTIVNGRPTVAMTAAALLLLAAGFIAMRSTRGAGANPIEQRYYYDMASGELLVMDNQPAPVTTPGGSQAVGAEVYACGGCDQPAQRFIAHLQKYTDEAKQEAAKPLAQQDWDTVNGGNMVALPPRQAGDTIHWYHVESREGIQISQAALQGRCAQGVPQPCVP